MSLALLLPSALIALLALLLPLLLHLVRQTEQKRIEFAALRWLVARAQPRRRPRFNEWLLLALRLLLLALLALWLAQPVLRGRPDLRPWIVVAPTIDATQMAAHTPARTPKDAQWHWLAPGFPPIGQPAPSTPASIASLLRELDATLPAGVALTAIVPEQFDATDAQRPRLGRAITWTPVPGTSAFAPPVASKPMRIAAFSDAGHQLALPYLRAVATAWGTQAKPPGPTATLRVVQGVDALHADDTHLLWFSSSTIPAGQQQWVRSGGVILLAQDSTATALDWRDAQVAWRDPAGTPLAVRVVDGKGAWLRMLVPFTPQSLPALLEPDFPLALKAALEARQPIATRAWAGTYAPAVDAQAQRAAPSPRPLGGLLAMLIALVFGTERWLAMSVRRFGQRMSRRAPSPQLLHARWRMRAGVRVLLFAAPWIAVTVLFALREPAQPARWLLTAAGCVATLAWLIHSWRRHHLAWFARQLDRHPGFEDSAGLLLGLEPPASSLDRLQRDRLQAGWKALGTSVVRPRARFAPILWNLLAALACAMAVWSWQRPIPEPIRAQLPPALAQVLGVQSPSLRKLEIQITPPAYTGLPARTVATADVRAPEASTLRWALHFSVAPKRAWLQVQNGPRIELLERDGRWQAEHRIDRSRLYRIVSEPALPPAQRRLHRIDMIRDQPPLVRATTPAQSLSLRKPGQRVWPLVFEATDDHGVAARAELRIIQTSGEGENISSSERTLAITGSGPARKRRFAYVFDLARSGLTVGNDVIVQLTRA